MNGLSAELRKTVSIAAVVIGAVICVIYMFFADNNLSAIISVLIGTAVSVINFNIMALAGERAIVKSPGKAKAGMTISYLVRYGIYILVLIIAFKIKYLDIVGIVLGFFTSILALYLTQVLNTPGNRDKLKKLLSRAK